MVIIIITHKIIIMLAQDQKLIEILTSNSTQQKIIKEDWLPRDKLALIYTI